MSAAKRQSESRMVTMLQLAPVALKPIPPKQTVTKTQDRSSKRDFSIQASRTLSEKPAIINYWKQEHSHLGCGAAGHVARQKF
jgi:hypothetical protein